MKKVRCVTEDEIDLVGFLYDSSNKSSWNLIFPGVDGNILTNEFIDVLGNQISRTGFNFLCCHHRGSFQIISSNPLDSIRKGKTIGSVFENFNDCVYDFDAWINYAIMNGAKNINLIGHSHGCNKLIYYMSTQNKFKSYINNVILLSPLDLKTRMSNRREVKDLFDRADNLKKQNDLNSFICCGFFYKNFNSFYDMMCNKNLDNFPMMNKENNNFSQFNSIDKNIYIVYGEEEKKYINHIEEKRKYLNKNIKDISILNNTGHIYQGKETELANLLLEFIKEDGAYE